MKKIAFFLVIFSFLLGFCVSVKSRELLEITDGKLISVTQTVLSEGVPTGLTAEGAAKLVRGQTEKISAKETKTEPAMRYLLLWKKTTTVLKEVSYQDGQWQENVLPETKTTEVSVNITLTLGFLTIIIMSGMLVAFSVIIPASAELTIPGLGSSLSFLFQWILIAGLSLAETFLSIGGLFFWQRSLLAVLVSLLWSTTFRDLNDDPWSIHLWPTIFFGICSLLFINWSISSFYSFHQDALGASMVIVIATIMIPALFFFIASLFAKRGYVIV